MATPLKSVDPATDVGALMRGIGQRARAAARVLALAPAEQKDRALRAMAAALRAQTPAILAANREDVAEARANGQPASYIDRLSLDEKRVGAMAEGVETVAELLDPVGVVTERLVGLVALEPRQAAVTGRGARDGHPQATCKVDTVAAPALVHLPVAGRIGVDCSSGRLSQ